MIHGRNLIVALDGVPVAGAKSCQFQISQNFIKACSPTEGRTKRKVPTDYDWSMSVDCLIPSSTLSVLLVDKLIAGTRVLLTFTDGSGQNRAGFAYVKSCDEGGPVGGLATFSASFESDGALYNLIKYNTEPFTEGENLYMYIDQSNDQMVYYWSGSITYGVQVITTKPSILYPMVNNVWVVYKETFANIKYSIEDEESTDLYEAEVAHGHTEGKIVQLEANETYTILTDNHDGPSDGTLFFVLQEV